jgi:hypothetical protein
MKQFEILLAKAASDLAAARHLLRVQDIELDMGVIFSICSKLRRSTSRRCWRSMAYISRRFMIWEPAGNVYPA